MKLVFSLSFAAALLSTPINAEPQSIEPLITTSKIQDIGIKCKAEIRVSEIPSYNEDTGDIVGRPMLYVGVERSNSPEAILCVQDNVPTVMTGMVGREKGVPPLDQEILAGILKGCGWTETDGFIAFVDGDELHFRPSTEAGYDRVDCVLAGIRPYDPEKFGFVGNESYSTEEDQK